MGCWLCSEWSRLILQLLRKPQQLFSPQQKGGSLSVIIVYSAEARYRARARARPEEPEWGARAQARPEEPEWEAGVFGDGLALLSEPSSGGSPLPTERGMERSSGHGPRTAPSPQPHLLVIEHLGQALPVPW